MTAKGIDIAWDQPTISQIKGVGATFVARYFSLDPTKNLTAAEVRDYAAASLGTVTVWETTATRALDGYAAGQADAHTAEQQRAAVGLPSNHVHHFAVDTDTGWASVAPYFAGAASVIGQARTGVYGGLKVIEGAAAAGYRYLWQTDAWSGGVWSAHATIRQEGGTCLAGQADYDTAEVVDFGQYPRPTPPEDIVTPQDKQDIANLVLKGMPAVMQSVAVRDGLALAGAWWWEHIITGTTTPSMSPTEVALINDIHKGLTELKATPKPAEAAAVPAAAQVAPAPTVTPAKP